MDNISLKCPQCGATMTTNADKSEACCSYCGYKMIIKKEKSDDEKIRLAKDLSYARELGQQQAEKERQSRKTRRIAITTGILAIVICVSFLFTQYSKPKIDPFDYVEITFTGIDGQGKATVNLLNGKDDIDVSQIQYDVSPSKDLSQGDYVTVNVSSNIYRLDSSSKKYKVEGLQQYLTDLNVLTDDQLQILYDENTELQEYNLSSAYSDVQWSTIAPVQICLLNDNDKVSNLFVISEVTGTYDNLSKTHYLVSEMDDVIATDQSISFKSSKYNGNLSGSVSENGRGFIYSYTSFDAAISDIKSSDASLTYSEKVLK